MKREADDKVLCYYCKDWPLREQMSIILRERATSFEIFELCGTEQFKSTWLRRSLDRLSFSTMEYKASRTGCITLSISLQPSPKWENKAIFVLLKLVQCTQKLKVCGRTDWILLKLVLDKERQGRHSPEERRMKWIWGGTKCWLNYLVYWTALKVRPTFTTY